MGNEQRTLPGCEAAVGSEAQAKQESEVSVGKPRYEVIDREQLCWRPIDIERLIGAEHPARAVWEFIGRLDLSPYQEEARAVEGKAGRPGWEPRLLVSLCGCMGTAKESDRRERSKSYANGSRRTSG